MKKKRVPIMEKELVVLYNKLTIPDKTYNQFTQYTSL